MGKPDRGLHDRRCHRIGFQVHDKRFVHFERIHRELPQVGQGRVSRPIVIHGDVDSHLAQGCEDGRGADPVEHQRCFGDFELERPRGQPVQLKEIRDFGRESRVEQIGRGEVDRYTDVQADVPPPAALPQRKPEDLQRQRTHQPGVLGQGQEDIGLEEALGGMFPSYERLHPVAATRTQVDLHLVMDPQLIIAEPASQRLNDVEPVWGVHVRARPVVLDPGTGGLGRIHRDIRPLQQDARGDRVVRVERGPDARVHVQGDRTHIEGVPQRCEHPLGDHFGDRRVRILQDDGELVSAEAGQQVRRAQCRRDPAPDEFQQIIADRMAKGIVDFFETVEIEHE